MNRKNGSVGIGLLLLVIAVIALIIQGARFIFADYNFENIYMSSWNLADKSSTIQAKYEYIDKFVITIEENKRDFARNDAIFLKTPNNSFDYNLKALETLRNRLKEIQGLDINSFAYQTAIQQITAQEQGEAHQLIYVIEECYYLQSYTTLWGWIGGIVLFVIVLIGVVGLILILNID